MDDIFESSAQSESKEPLERCLILKAPAFRTRERRGFQMVGEPGVKKGV